MPNELENVDFQVEKHLEIFVKNQCNIDIRCLSLHHIFLMIMQIHITIKTKKASNTYKKAKTKIINSGN